MFENEQEFQTFVDKLNIDVSASPSHREELRRKMLATFQQGQNHSLKEKRFSPNLRSSLFRLAVAAMIALCVGLSAYHFVPVKKTTTANEICKNDRDPAADLTLGSLRLAYIREGTKGVEKRYEEFFRDWNPGQPILVFSNSNN